MPTGDYNPFAPSGYDRATGLNGLPGTATPAGFVVVKNNNVGGYFFEEMPDSPRIERGEQTTIEHRFKCDPVTGLIYIQGLQRGQIMVDSQGNLTKVLSSSADYQKPDHWILTVIAEGMSGITTGDGVSALDVPPDEFGVETIELNPSIYRHPRYASVLNYVDGTTGTTGTQIFQWINAAINSAQLSGQAAAETQINSSTITNASVLALAQELLSKVRQGFDTFYLAGFKVTYSYYDFMPPDINPGGYIEDPVFSGQLPSYFWSDDGSGHADSNIFTSLAREVAPAFYTDPTTGATSISWLRQADVITYQRTWFKSTWTWIGGPYGTWDEDIYSPSFD